ncbi:MAG: ECF transporter S component [Promethearchaeota archaeon]
MKSINPFKSTKGVAITGIFTALTTVVTMILAIPIPASSGYFNFGEALIYVTAFLFGPYVAFVTGGVGSALADLFLGYGYYAPGTFIIKGLEGLVVGYIFYRFKTKLIQEENEDPNSSKKSFNILTIGALLCCMIICLGIWFGPGLTILWVVFGVLAAITSVIAVIWSRVNLQYFFLPVTVGAAIMITGYALYGMYVSTALYNLMSGSSEPLVNVGALAEIPFNVLQCAGGFIVSISIYQPLYKSKVADLFVKTE